MTWSGAIMREFAEEILGFVRELKEEYDGEDLWDHAEEVGRAVLEAIQEYFDDDF